MDTATFLQVLEENKERELLFEYSPGKFAGTNYHITEVKNILVESVDCGAGTDSWKETVVQLWESPMEKGKTDYMTAYKALGILKKVNKMRPMDSQSELKIEYGNAEFHTAQLQFSGYRQENNRLIISLGVEATACKAQDVCGVPEEEEASTTAAACCSPSSGCC